MERSTKLVRDPRVAACAVAVAYVVVLVERFPRLIGYENANSDVASAYVLADAVSHGHTGHVVMSAQAMWLPLWYGLLTHGLSFHRVLWEISPALLLLAAAVLIGWTVAHIASAAAGLLSTALIIAASPTALFDFTAPAYHNLTIPGAALLGAYLVWLVSGQRSRRALIATVAVLSLLVGTFLASDELLAIAGLVPFVAAALLVWLRERRPGRLYPVAGLVGGSIVVAIVTSHVMGALNFSDNPPPIAFTRRLIPQHIKWLVQGLLHFGNGLSVAPHGSARTVLVVVAAAVTVAGIGATMWLGIRSLGRSRWLRGSPSLAAHSLFWVASLVCAAAAYVVTTFASYPQTERYFLVAIPAVAATTARVARRSAISGAVIFRGTDAGQAAQIQALVRSQHLGVGYAGYWDAANVDWITHERLQIYPLTDRFGPVEPMYQNRVAAWYVPRPRTRSYLVLAPGDDNLADAIPPALPTPTREFHLGPVTVVAYPNDIAKYLRPPRNGSG